ncbi:MAG: von Willebrand factor [Chthoniobacteraceae bacterium]|nr:von Willebrand factor [Chthoniobacteraceae bacterium]
MMSPREELEVRLTAMLMGELSPEETAALEAEIASDPALAALHAKLRRTTELLREAVTIPDETPLRLSNERRERLLAHFKKPTPAAVILRPRWKSAVPLALAASIAVLLGGSLFWINDYDWDQRGINSMARSGHWASQPGTIRRYSSDKKNFFGESRGGTGARADINSKVDAPSPSNRFATSGFSDFKLGTPMSGLPSGGSTPAVDSKETTLNFRGFAKATDADEKLGESSLGLTTGTTGGIGGANSGAALEDMAGAAVTLNESRNSEHEALATLEPAAAQPASVDTLTRSKNAPASGPAAGSKQSRNLDTIAEAGERIAVQKGIKDRGEESRVTSATALSAGRSSGQPDGGSAAAADSEEKIKSDSSAKTKPAQNAGVEIKGKLVEADGFFQSGRYDIASKKAKEVLSHDPHNIAARKLEEKINQARDNYDDTAYNEARARSVWSVNRAWENPVRKFAGKAETATDPNNSQEMALAEAQPQAPRPTADGQVDTLSALQSPAQPPRGYALNKEVALNKQQAPPLSDADNSLQKKTDSSNELASAGKKSEAPADVALGQETEKNLATASEGMFWETDTQKKMEPASEGASVKWLYVLKDGSIGASSRASEANPITGRTAFWTDDNASKLNIDTAEHPGMWDENGLPANPQPLNPASLGYDSGKAGDTTPAIATSNEGLKPLSLSDKLDRKPHPDGEKRAEIVLGRQQNVPALESNNFYYKQGDVAAETTKSAPARPASPEVRSLEEAESTRSPSTAVEPRINSRTRAMTPATSAPAKPAAAKPEEIEPKLEQAADFAAIPATPSKPADIPQPEVLTSANAFSTFSLNVSDVAFKLAGASLEQGKMPEPSTIRSEEFINAFDYHDPEAAPGAPIAFASERARYPFAQNRDLLRLSVKTAAAGRQPGRPLNLVLLLDNSGSMERADRVRILRESLTVLAKQLQPQDHLSIITFARTPRLWVDGVAGNQAGEAIARVGEITPQGGTNLAAALDLGYETALRHYQVGSISRVVLLTDGAANLGDVDPAALKQKVEAHRKQGVALDCFGIGWEGYNDDLLEQLSRNGDGRYGFINTPEQAATEFAGQLAGALRVAASDVKVQVEFNPRRVTAYRQVGYAKHQLTKEQFRDNTVDAAEIGAAESGNALYVVEVNPRGEGDLATVRVRFKVPGTSDYREHEWAVPFTCAAPPFEQAVPSLRLAGTASAFSEWLAGSPFAAEVTSDRLLGYLNGVPPVYGADPRPPRLEWMIRQAKSISGR